jgi:hypothetical protein
MGSRVDVASEEGAASDSRRAVFSPACQSCAVDATEDHLLVGDHCVTAIEPVRTETDWSMGKSHPVKRGSIDQ